MSLEEIMKNPHKRQLQEIIKCACTYGDYNTVKKFLEYPKFNPALNKNCAIVTAAQYNHRDIVELLLKDPRTDPNSALRNDTRPEMIEILLKDPRLSQQLIKETMYHAENTCQYCKVEILLKASKKKYVHFEETFIHFSREGRIDIINIYLSDQEFCPWFYYPSSLLVAKDYKTLKRLLEYYGMDYGICKKTTVYAIIRGRYFILQTMIRYPMTNILSWIYERLEIEPEISKNVVKILLQEPLLKNEKTREMYESKFQQYLNDDTEIMRTFREILTDDIVILVMEYTGSVMTPVEMYDYFY